MLNDKKIQGLVDSGDLVRPFSMDLLQPHSYDATLGEGILLACYDAETKSKEWKPYIGNEFVLQPGDFALGTTEEYFKLTQNLVGFVQGKSTVGRNGLQIECAGLIDAGFHGKITLELYNMAPWPITLTKGMKICQIHFSEVESPVWKDYQKIGHYQGQQTTTLPVYQL